VGAVSETLQITSQSAPIDRADETKLEANQSVNAAIATTAESEVIANPKELSHKKVANAPRAATSAELGDGSGPGAPVFQWTLSPQGAVQRSMNGGKTWQSVSVPDHASFRTLSAVGRDIWVGGKSGSLYHSPDSGQHWVRVTPDMDGQKLSADITRVDFSDLQKGIVSTSNGQMWATSDGGKSWLRK
jgi:photosystem II stability/assembly factor-like uncharacterized protein